MSCICCDISKALHYLQKLATCMSTKWFSLSLPNVHYRTGDYFAYVKKKYLQLSKVK